MEDQGRGRFPEVARGLRHGRGLGNFHPCDDVGHASALSDAICYEWTVRPLSTVATMRTSAPHRSGREPLEPSYFRMGLRALTRIGQRGAVT